MPLTDSNTADLEDAPDDGAPVARPSAGVIVKPVVNAVRILRYLTQKGAPERAADIARQMAINPSTCFNILRTLVSEDVVDFNPLSKTYSAGLGLARLMEQLVTLGQRLQTALPHLRELAARFGVTVTLWRRAGGDRIVLVHSEASPTALHIDMPIGQRLPILMGASGRLFVGRMGLSDDEIRHAFEQLRWARSLSFDNYLREVNRARRRGWAVDDGYFSSGVMAVAAPVCDQSGNIAFAVSAVMFRGKRSEAEIQIIGEALRDLGHRLETVLF